MNLVKNILAVASVCLTLLSCAFAESVSESENSFSVSGKNYRIEFDKSCGAIRKIFSNDRELSLKIRPTPCGLLNLPTIQKWIPPKRNALPGLTGTSLS